MPETNNKQTLPISGLSETPLNQEIKFNLTENPTKEALKEYIERIKDTRKQETDALAKEILGEGNTTENLIAQLKQDIQTSSVEAPKPDEAPAPEEAPPPAGGEEGGGDEKNKEPLPLAPTTTFNILRLIQRGYIPINPIKPKEGKGFFGKTLQGAKYIYYGVDLAFLKIQKGGAKSQEHGISKIYEKLGADLKKSPYFNQVVKTEIDTISKELIAYEAVNKPNLKVIERLKGEIETLKKIKGVLDKPGNNVLELHNLADEYIKSRGNYTPVDIWRKTPADITTENANATKKVDDARKTIQNLEKDLKAEKNGGRDSRGNTVKTENEIKKDYDEGKRKNIETLDKEIEIERKKLEDAQQAKDKANEELNHTIGEHKNKTAEISDIDKKIGGRTVALLETEKKNLENIRLVESGKLGPNNIFIITTNSQISKIEKELTEVESAERQRRFFLTQPVSAIQTKNLAEIDALLGNRSSTTLNAEKLRLELELHNEMSKIGPNNIIIDDANRKISALAVEIKEIQNLEHRKTTLEGELRTLGQLDARGNVIPGNGTLGTIQGELDDAKRNYTDAETKLKVLNERKIIVGESRDVSKKQILEEKTKRIALLEKRKRNWENSLQRRITEETKIRTINNEISAVQGKIADIERIDTDLATARTSRNNAEIKRLERLRNSKINQRQELLKRLGELRAEKDAVAQTFYSTESKDKTTVDAEIVTRQEELDKFNDLAHEFDELNNKIAQLRQEAVDLTNKLNNPSTDTKEAFEFHEKASKRIGEIASEINQINAIGQEKFNGSGINWPDISPLELAGLRKKNGFFAFMEKHAQAPTLDSPSKGWKFAKGGGYGAMKLVALTGVVRQGIHSGVALSKEQVFAGTYDATDLVLGFIPGIWGGSYDMLIGAQQLVMGKDIIGRKVEAGQAWTRLGFGALAFVTLGGSKYLELAVKGGKLAKLGIDGTRAISTVEGIENITNISKVTQKVGTGVYGTYALVDMGGQLIKNPTAYITGVEAPKSEPQATKATGNY